MCPISFEGRLLSYRLKHLHIAPAKPRNSKPFHRLPQKWLIAVWRAKDLMEPDLQMSGKGSFDPVTLEAVLQRTKLCQTSHTVMDGR